jgi:hypothetical protein
LANDGSTTDTTPFENTATGKIITVPLGGRITVEFDDSDVLTLVGAFDVNSLASATRGFTNGKVTLTASSADRSPVLTAAGLGTHSITVGAAADPAVTATNTVYIKVVASCNVSAFVAATSYVSVEDTSVAATNNVDTSAAQADTESGFLSIVGNNEYGTTLPSGSWIVSATNGARVDIADDGAATATSTGPSVDTVTADGSDIRVAVKQATGGVAMSSVVTVSYNGVTVASRTFSWTGDLASIKVSGVRIMATGLSNYNSFTVKTYDAAGNQIGWADANLTLTGFDQNVTGGDVVATATAAAETTSTNDNNYVTCGTGAKGTTKLKVKGVTGAATTIYSDEFSVSCAGAVYSYTASLDKASYVPGDIATLTITGKDVNGALTYGPTGSAAGQTADQINYVYGSSGTAPAIAGSNMTAVAAPTAGDYFLAGVKTYQFVVGATEGSYQMTVNLADIDDAVAVPYTIKASTAAVSNAEVLAAIVKLIASINKQIRALQKSLRR